MLTVKMESDKSLIITVPGTIYEKETNVDMIRFLIPPEYDGMELNQFTTIIKYTTPDREPHCEKLVLQNELYKGYLDYRLGVNTKITRSPGDVYLRVTFLRLNLTDFKKVAEQVMTTEEIVISVKPLDHLYHYHCHGGECVDQIYLELNAKLEAANNMINSINKEKADDIEIIHNAETGEDEIWVVSEGKPIGDPISIPESGGSTTWEEL